MYSTIKLLLLCRCIYIFPFHSGLQDVGQDIHVHVHVVNYK